MVIERVGDDQTHHELAKQLDGERAPRTSSESTTATFRSSAIVRMPSTTCSTSARPVSRAAGWTGNGSSPCPWTARSRSASAPMSAASGSATGGTCSPRRGCPRTGRWSASCGPPGRTTSRSGARSRRHDLAVLVDSSIRVYNAVLAQQESGYYDNTGNVVVATNPSVQRAFDFALQLVSTGESAKLKSNTAPWTAALQAGKFATMMCPAWGLGQLQQSAPDARGKWDLAEVPGGGGNWGGSFLAIPKQSRHAKEAYQLAAWLTAPEQQLRIFKESGNLPSADPVQRSRVDGFQERVREQRAGRGGLRGVRRRTACPSTWVRRRARSGRRLRTS